MKSMKNRSLYWSWLFIYILRIATLSGRSQRMFNELLIGADLITFSMFSSYLDPFPHISIERKLQLNRNSNGTPMEFCWLFFFILNSHGCCHMEFYFAHLSEYKSQPLKIFQIATQFLCTEEKEREGQEGVRTKIEKNCIAATL